MERHRDHLAAGLRGAGFRVLEGAGTYFLCVDIAGLDPDGDDFAFCRRLVAESGVAAVPVSSFYADRDVRSLIRLCFAKRLPLLEEAVDRLAAWGERAGLVLEAGGAR